MTLSPDAAESLAHRAGRARAERWRSSHDVVEFHDRDHVHWRVRREWLMRLTGREALPPGEGLPFADWIASPTTTVVKHGPHRSVYRLTLDGATVYLKHDRVLRWTDVVRRMLKPSPSRREWMNSAALAQRGVPTIQPIAYGETMRAGVVRDSYFLSQEIPHSEQLDDFLARSLSRRLSAEDAGRRKELIAALAELCVRCHEAGVDHQDFHAGNILIQTPPTGSGQLRLFLIDLPAVAFRRPLAWSATRNSLAMLNTGLRDLTKPHERHEFLLTYFKLRDGLTAPPLAAAAAEISARTWRLAQSNFHSRDKRAVRRNQDFQPHRFSHGSAYAVVEVRRAEASAVIADAASRSFARPRAASAWQRVEMDIGGGRRVVACKAYDDWTRGLSWRRFWRWTPGLRRWVVGQALLARGISTPRPWIVWRSAGGANAGRIIVACDWMANSLPLNEALAAIGRFPETSRRAMLDALARRVGRVLGDLHRWGATHHDLDATSLLITLPVADSPGRRKKLDAALVNLDRVALGRSENTSLAATDLRRLAGSLHALGHDLDARTLKRFLTAYFSTFRLPHEARRRRLAALAALTRTVANRPL